MGYVSESLVVAIGAAVVAVVLSGSLFIVDGIFLALRDLAVTAAALALVPVAWTTFRYFRPANVVNALMLSTALVGVLVTVVGSLDRVAGILGTGTMLAIPPGQTQGLGLALVGAWVLAVSFHGRRHGTAGRGATTAGNLTGLAGLVLGATAATIGPHPLLYVAAVIAVAAFVVWATRFRRVMGSTGSGSGYGET